MAAGAKRVGYKEVHTGNMAINSEPRDDRPACHQIGFCMHLLAEHGLVGSMGRRGDHEYGNG